MSRLRKSKEKKHLDSASSIFVEVCWIVSTVGWLMGMNKYAVYLGEYFSKYSLALNVSKAGNNTANDVTW